LFMISCLAHRTLVAQTICCFLYYYSLFKNHEKRKTGLIKKFKKARWCSCLMVTIVALWHGFYVWSLIGFCFAQTEFCSGLLLGQSTSLMECNDPQHCDDQ
jgi:hypothetical protein